MTKYAFKKGWYQLPNGKTAEAREKIKKALGFTSDATFYARMKGIPEPTISEYRSIEAIFKEYGITHPWG